MTERFAVLGSPIAHSKSPVLHRAALRVRGVDATYESVEVTEETLPEFLAGCSDEWRGLSLTMPLKEAIQPFLEDQDEVSRHVGAVNTVFFTESGLLGYNTDVWGAQQAMAELLAGVVPHTAVMLGAGATARSCLLALYNLGTRQVTVLVRNPHRAESLVQLAERLGVSLEVRSFDSAIAIVVDIAVSTLPSGVDVPHTVLDSLSTRYGFDVAYSPWPTLVARSLQGNGAATASGLTMLVWQAVRQQRIFASGNPDQELDNEPAVIAAMFAAVGIDRP
ncbi:MAG: hypothetical protein RIS25_396 [Actinomycetota bacterium]